MSFGTSTRTHAREVFSESKKRPAVTYDRRRQPPISDQYARVREGAILSVRLDPHTSQGR
jgi:hypothetical protein